MKRFGLIALPYRCEFCGIPILPERAKRALICESTGCAQMLADSYHPERSIRISKEEFAARVAADGRMQSGNLAGGYRGKGS